MTEKLQIYKCDICGNIIEITHEGADALVCCGEVMELLKENLASSENFHYAHIEKIDELTKKISFNHVITQEHHIEYIEAISNDGKYLKRKFLKHDEKPEMSLKCDCKEGFYIRLYCNKDGVWITK